MTQAAAIRPPWGSVLVVRDHVLVMGMPGCGKTPYAAGLAKDARRAVFFDAAGDWRSEGEAVGARDLFDAPHLLAGTFARYAVQPGNDLGKDFALTVEACRGAAGAGGLVLLVDEAGDLARECGELLLALHRNGHKDGLASVLVSPCATDFPKRCRDTATRVYSFFQKSADDVATLDREYGHDFGTRARAWRYPAPPVEWRNPVLHDAGRRKAG